MKKIINSILAFVTLFSVTSCDLDMDPETAIRPEDAYTMEYCEGVRLSLIHISEPTRP